MRAVKWAGSIAAMVSAAALGAPVAIAHESESVNVVFERAIPNLPGKKMIAVVVDYPPGGKSQVHRHAGSAFVYAHVLSGSIRSQVDDGPTKVFRAGEGFHEDPGSLHAVSENANDREPASLLAVFVVDARDTTLTLPGGKQGSPR